MAIYRHIHIDYWQDGFILDLTPEEKYFYIYLMTNSKTSQCGIYELPKRIIETETGYNRETVEKLIKRFEEYKKIVYCNETKEVFLKNWIKHNMTQSPKVKRCIEKELKEVKSKVLLDLFLKECNKYGYSIDTVCIPVSKGEFTLEHGYGEKEKEKQKEKQKEKYKDKENNSSNNKTTKSRGDNYERFKKEYTKSKYAKGFESEDESIYRKPTDEEVRLIKRELECFKK